MRIISISENKNIEKRIAITPDIVKKYRNKSKRPLMLIYPAQSKEANEIEMFPLLYCFIPVLDNAQKVTYIIRNK